MPAPRWAARNQRLVQTRRAGRIGGVNGIVLMNARPDSGFRRCNVGIGPTSATGNVFYRQEQSCLWERAISRNLSDNTPISSRNIRSFHVPPLPLQASL